MKKSPLLIALLFIVSFSFSQISLTSSVTNVSCYGLANGSATISATGGTAPYTYTWIPTNTNFDIITGLTAGTYTVNVEDALANTNSLAVTIGQPTILVASATATDALCFGTATGTINIFVSGGIPNYSYSLNGSAFQSSSSYFGLSAGVYTVDIKDANNCIATQTVQVNQPALFTSSISAFNNITCFGMNDGSATATPVGGVGGPYTYSWMPGGQTTATAINLSPGTYTATIMNFGGCLATTSVTITQPTQLNATTTSTNVLCNGACNGAFNTIASGGIAPYTFFTSVGSVGPYTSNVCASAITITVQDANNCILTKSVTITQPPPLTASTAVNNANCGQANGSLCASVLGGVGAVSYTWSNGVTSSCNNNIPAGAYTFTVIDLNGCSTSASGLVNDIGGPLVSITSQTHVACFGLTNGAATSTVTGGTSPYSFSWSGAGTSTTSSISNIGAGIHNVTVIDNSGCVGTASVLISQPQQISISMSFTNASCGMCDGQVYSTVMGGTPGYMYTWSPAVGGNTWALNGLCPSIYTLQITDVQGCLKTSTVTVASSGAGPLSGVTTTLISIDETCANSNDGSIDITLGGSNLGPFTYQWSNGSTNQDIFNISAGTYIVTIFDTGMNCLTLSNNISVTGINCGSIAGNVFIDNNSDCIKNSGDYNYTNAPVIVNPGNRYGYANYNGDYIINNLPYGTYSVSLNINPSGNLFPTCNTTINSIINSGNQNSLNNILTAGFNSGTQPDLNVTAWNQGVVPGFVCRMNYNLNNLNNVNGTGLFKVILPSAFIPNITNAYPSVYTISGDTVIWPFSNIVYNIGSTYFYVDFTTPLSTPLGSIFTTCMFAQPNINDFNPANNTFCYARTVNGSFDPNDKTVSPIGVGPNGDIAATETDLTYLIRFQNTGNGPAVNIVVKDTLSPNVDINTFEMLSSSHNYDIDILQGNILRWKFNNIMLADSNSNEPASHGYIQYRIKRNSNNTPGTQIKNTAYIYFDFNEPVVTNTAINTIETVTGIKSQSSNDNEWNIYPNPSTGILYIVNHTSLKEASQIQVLNSIGQTVFEETITSNYKNIDLSKLNNGVYFVKIVSDKQSVIKRVVLSK